MRVQDHVPAAVRFLRHLNVLPIFSCEGKQNPYTTIIWAVICACWKRRQGDRRIIQTLRSANVADHLIYRWNTLWYRARSHNMNPYDLGWGYVRRCLNIGFPSTANESQTDQCNQKAELNAHERHLTFPCVSSASRLIQALAARLMNSSASRLTRRPV